MLSALPESLLKYDWIILSEFFVWDNVSVDLHRSKPFISLVPFNLHFQAWAA